MDSGARSGDGLRRRRLLFAALVGVYLLGLYIAVVDKLERVGRPDVGWTLDDAAVSPTRHDAADLGLRGGARIRQVNGVDFSSDYRLRRVEQVIRTEIGDVNELVIEKPGGELRTLQIPVRPWRWRDALFTQGAVDFLGLLFAALGISVFLLRPWASTSWALLVPSVLVGGVLSTQFLPIGPADYLRQVYFAGVVGMSCVVPLHLALSFPVPHPLLVGRGATLWLVYGLGAVSALLLFVALSAGEPRSLAFVPTLTTGLLSGSILILLGRWGALAARSGDPVVAQRARILLVGGLLGLAPLGIVVFLQVGLDRFPLDIRFAYWLLALFFVALARVTLRPELMNARIAVRRAVIYAAAVALLTALAVALVSFRPYAVAALLLPLLYVWPRFVARLNERLYPKRSQLPGLAREVGGEMAACSDLRAVLGVLAAAPERLCDARSGVAFLLPNAPGGAEQIEVYGTPAPRSGRPLADEPLVQLMVTTRNAVFRDHVAVEPQYANIQRECYACLDRLHAEVLLPIVTDQGVVGGLAVGPRASRDVYEDFELDVLSTLAYQAYQAITRIRATDRLREREREFGELTRFFPPQIIEEVLERGGASELGSHRKPVTVFFADLRGFTAFSERAEPEEVMATLGEYYEAMGKRVAECGGTLERFTGDGFMVFFNDPVDQPDHVERAARMALAMQRDLEPLRADWRRRGFSIDVGMGLHTGYATVGFIGYEGRRDYGVIGNVTNLAARLSDAAQGGEVLVSERVLAELGESFRTEPAGEFSLKGFRDPQAAHRLLDSGRR